MKQWDRSHLRKPAVERFLAKVEVRDGCWQWKAHFNEDNYGTFESTTAHRWLYVTLFGMPPPGHQLDHLCCNTQCVRPDHLEPVLPRVNTQRSPVTLATRFAARTHCVNGHEFTAANTYRRPLEPNARRCRTCMAARTRQWEKRKATEYQMMIEDRQLALV